jgi:hypothetical protein
MDRQSRQCRFENAMRGASNKRHGEKIATGMVTPLNASTPANAVYDTAGMKVQMTALETIILYKI